MNSAASHQDFLQWYEPIHAAFVRYCSSRTYGWMDTEDLVQETVLATLEAFYRIDKKEKLLSYMIGVANNKLKNKWRRSKFQAAWQEDILEKMESRIGDPELALDIRELHRGIDQLPEKQKEALLLFEISGFSIRELAAIQDSSESAVKTRLSRARQALKALLNENNKASSKRSFAQQLALYASLF